MGIAAVIARAKKTVQAGGLPGIVVELSDTLRSEAIPAPLRQAAARIADLLRVSEPPPRMVVPLVPERAPHAVDANMNEAHGGVCPFTGQSAASLEGEQDMNTVASHMVADLVADASAAVRVEAGGSAREQNVETTATDAPEAGESVEPSEARKAPASSAPVKSSAASKPVPSSKAVAPSKSSTPAGPAGKAKATNEKSRGEVAAKPSPAKTSGRSSKGPTGKQSGAKKKK